MPTAVNQGLARPSDIASGVVTLMIAYTPDSDDLFNFYAWEHGHTTLPGCDARFRKAHIRTLNDAAARGLYEVVAISSVVYPSLADQYRILSVGSSVGRGYGPVLASPDARAFESRVRPRIAIPGQTTTGGYLAQRFYPNAEFISAPYDEIARRTVGGEFDAGVMIHEELIHFPRMGLERVCDLGARWSEESGLPLPVGLSVVHRRVGLAMSHTIARACAESIRWAIDHADIVMPAMRELGRGCADEFVPMFSNSDTLCMPEDVRRGMRVLFDQVADAGIGPKLDRIEVIDA